MIRAMLQNLLPRPTGGRARRRGRLAPDAVFGLLALSAGWFLLVMGTLHVLGLTQLPAETP